MKRFTFRLERLLDLRTALERERARILAEARQAEAERLAAVEASRQRLAEACAQVSATPAGFATAGSLCNLDLAVARLAADAEAASAEHLKSAAAADQEMARYSEAATARRAVERLREHRFADWSQAASRAEQHDNDETALRLSQRRGPETP